MFFLKFLANIAPNAESRRVGIKHEVTWPDFVFFQIFSIRTTASLFFFFSFFDLRPIIGDYQNLLERNGIMGLPIIIGNLESLNMTK